MLLLHGYSNLKIELAILAPDDSAALETSLYRLESILALLCVARHQLSQCTQILVADIQLQHKLIVDDHFRLYLALEAAKQLSKGPLKLADSLSKPLEIYSYLVHYA
jgi:hypothetical protein